ncbi:MAG: hypothetical protein U5K00_21390 [Melioribacteraceae bacterium]|nr:hypothetical protein [Melioribacteraceae bacterium]
MKRERIVVTKQISSDELLYRHWNHWTGPKRSHLFLMDLESNEHYDLTLGIETDTPTIALGSGHDYAISPDGKEAAFVMNNTGEQAWNTNNDVFIVSLENLEKGKASKIKKISVSEGNDNQPVYSPTWRIYRLPLYGSCRF